MRPVWKQPNAERHGSKRPSDRMDGAGPGRRRSGTSGIEPNCPAPDVDVDGSGRLRALKSKKGSSCR